MDNFEKEEFWKALNRLYLATENLRESTGKLRDIALAHESRLDKLEVVQEWLAQKERDRERGSQ